jgi:hypothetical protein
MEEYDNAWATVTNWTSKLSKKGTHFLGLLSDSLMGKLKTR